MDNVKNDLYYVDKIKSDLKFMIKHTQDLTYDDFCTDEVLLDSVMFRLIQVSENSDKLSDDFKKKYSHIPWREMRGLRNRIVHEYGNIDISVIYDTVTEDIPKLLLELSNEF